MKKIILYQLKSIQGYCVTFSCNGSAGFSSLHYTNMFSKSLFFYASLFLLAFGQASLYGQKVSGAAVKANFGIDADIYANHEQFAIPPVALSNVDDWFLNTSKWDGTGLNVILQDSVQYFKDKILVKNNTSFERRMSKPKNTTVGNYLWIDAVYGRDSNATQSNNDGTVFTKTTDKNGQDPSTWNLGSGGAPQKNDIVDVFGHLRRDLSSGSPGILWGFGGATTMSADGNSHNDFEYFRTDVTFNGSKLSNTGANEGHTAWEFGTDGAATKRGDILISIDFENGGTKPLGTVRVWMKKTDVVVATFNSNITHPNRPFDVTGVFDGTSGATYGYAEISKKGSVPTDPNAVNPDIFAVVNVTADTFGAPWGSLEGSTAKYFDDIKKLQFSEFGINLTAFGLDSRIGTANPCENLLGTLIVKTRSSSSFTAELKDFAGPYKFGNTETPVVSTQNLAACKNADGTNPSFDLSKGLVGTETTAQFYTSNPNVTPPLPTAILNPTIYTPTAASTTIYVRTEPGLNGCYAYGSFTLTVNPNPAPSVDDETACVGEKATFETENLGTTNFRYQWYKNNEIITGATSYSYETLSLASTDDGDGYKVVVTNKTTECYGEDSGKLTVNFDPTADAGDPPPAQCPEENGNDFTLNGTVNYGTPLWTIKAGGTAVGSIPSGQEDEADPIVHVTGVGSVTFVLTVTSDNTPSCGTDADEVTVTVKEKAGKPNVVYTAPKCDEKTFSITVTIADGAIYTIEDRNGEAIPGIKGLDTEIVGEKIYTATADGEVTFYEIPAGSGYRVTASINDCPGDTESCGTPDPVVNAAKVVSENAKTVSSGFDAYPVPFKDQLTIKYKYDYVSDVKIEVFNSRGISVLSKTDRASYLNKEITLDLKGDKEKEQVYVVKLTTDRETSTKKVLSSR